MYIYSGKSKCSSEVVYKVQLFLWSNVSLVMMWWVAKQSEIILSVLFIFWFIITKGLGGLEFSFFFVVVFPSLLWDGLGFFLFGFELVVRQMFPSDILLGFLLKLLYKNYKMFAKNLSCHILLLFNHIAVKLVFTDILGWSHLCNECWFWLVSLITLHTFMCQVC